MSRPSRVASHRAGLTRTRHEYIPVGSRLAVPGQTRSWTDIPEPGAPLKIRRHGRLRSKARSHNHSSVERFGAGDDPWRRNLPPSGSVFRPSGTLENRTFDREPCMFNTDEQLRLSTSYRGGRLSLEAVLTDLVCRVAPRLITNLEEYQEAGLAGLRIARSRQYQVRGRGTGGYCGIDVDARGRV